ncbi:glutamate receptor ionotropic, kainate 2 isoform X2 [Diorhabda carinulata]|uniref:glutamate receptor ionotropic, kainate 2 isoform X1 n=1 Tax=Diorhabda sublineata TaxID=1163346 RepID=UPI0024E084AC|nr:glutamate receptor ionotropic, kainate 2 isoform X1 [Diorhabda sublineata]XP_056633757.1 glutamate receptor ionotropic, kainate 2 isoform X1 [Diorhabda sublineata]XP_057665404.1 glutamate receptor ionotropic, kainate 2 isoform X2 [Diorhabda carinulata]
MHIVTLISLLLWSNFGYAGLPPVIRIGAIFTEDQKNSSVELAFKYAVYKINKERDLLPNTTLVYDIQYVPRDDSFRTSKKACRQVEFGVQAIFGPSDPILGAHIQSICEALDVPHIEARVDFEPTSKELSINLHPSQESMNKAFKDLMAFLNWTKVAIIYEEDYGLFKLQELVKAPGAARTEMYIRQAGPGSYRQVLREVRQKELYKLIVDTNPRNINQFFRAILQLQMNDYRYHYMFTTFDLETFDLEDFKYNSVNITAFRVVDVDHPKVKETLEVMEKFQPIGHAILNRSGVIQAEPALMFDSVYVFAKGLSGMENMQSIRPTNLSCDIEKPWDDGLTLYDYIDSVSGLHGLTGNLEFSEGKRTNFKVDLLKLKKEEIRKVGEWTVTNGINITDPNAFYENHTPNVTLIVMTREERPYVMVNEEKNLTGNARYEGFCIDLLKWIAAQVGFQYTIRLVPDHMYGVFDPDTKEWNGIVRELMEKRADLAVASMTINYARESVIDFTKPFMNLGIGILFKVSARAPAKLFAFLTPLAIEIWLYMVGGYVLVSLTIWIAARVSPKEWREIEPCDECLWKKYGEECEHFSYDGDGTSGICSDETDDEDSEGYFIDKMHRNLSPVDNISCKHDKVDFICEHEHEQEREYELEECGKSLDVLENGFTLGNSFWFAIGSLMQQGSDLNPKATSTRIVGGIWWFFTLIIISSYTANLAAFLTVERMITPIESAQDLAEQTEIAYGTLEGGSTMTFFRDSKIGIYQKMWRFMESRNPPAFVKSYEDGVKRVLEGDYAFLMESTMLDYAVQRDCNLTQIGGLLDSKGYGIATPKGSPWRDKISLAILELQEKGVIQILYDKWWKNTGDVCTRDDKSKESKANALGVENIGGVFVVLLCGLALAILVAILEFCWNSKKNAQTDRQSLCSEMAEELRFAVRCHGSRQRPALRRSCTRCSPATTYVPAALDLPHLNGEGVMLPMLDVKRSPINYEVDT